MKALDLVQQYQSGTITARELVERVWGDLSVSDLQVGWTISICAGELCLAQGCPEEAWTAAAAFTISRIEEIRLVKEELYWLHPARLLLSDKYYSSNCNSFERTRAARQSALAELSKGLKKEALI